MGSSNPRNPRSATNGEQAPEPTRQKRRLARSTKASLESRVAALEKEVGHLKASPEATRGPSQPWWEKISGTFADDPAYNEAMRLGREWRESFRPKPRKTPRKKTSDGPS